MSTRRAQAIVSTLRCGPFVRCCFCSPRYRADEVSSYRWLDFRRSRCVVVDGGCKIFIEAEETECVVVGLHAFRALKRQAY